MRYLVLFALMLFALTGKSHTVVAPAAQPAPAAALPAALPTPAPSQESEERSSLAAQSASKRVLLEKLVRAGKSGRAAQNGKRSWWRRYGASGAIGIVMIVMTGALLYLLSILGVLEGEDLIDVLWFYVSFAALVLLLSNTAYGNGAFLFPAR